MATSRTIAANGELVEDSEVLVIWDGLKDGTLDDAGVPQTVYCMLPDVVSGATGAAVDFLSAIEFKATGPIGYEVHEYGTGRLVAKVPPYGSIVLRSFDVGGDTSIVEWKLSDMRKEIIADAAQAAVAALSVTDGTTAASTMATAMAESWVAATANSEWDTEVDAVAADYETKTDTSFGEVETNLALFLARFAGGLIQETS